MVKKLSYLISSLGRMVMLMMMFSALVWAPLSFSSVFHSKKITELHQQQNHEIAGFFSSYAVEETEEEEFSEEDNFIFQAAFNFISSFSTLLPSKTYSPFYFHIQALHCKQIKRFILIRTLLI